MNENNENKTTIALKPYTVKELSQLYGVSRITFRKWLNMFKQELGEKVGIYYSIRQVRIIFQKLDLPGVIELDNGAKKETTS